MGRPPADVGRDHPFVRPHFFRRIVGDFCAAVHDHDPVAGVNDEIDVVLDHLGGKTAEASITVLNDGGSLISLAAPPEVALPEGRGVSARFFIVEPDRAELTELARLVDDGKLRVEVAEVFPLEAAAEAYGYGHRQGKVVLQPTQAAVGRPSASSTPTARRDVEPQSAGA